MQGNAFMQEQGEQAQALGLLHDFKVFLHLKEI